MDKQTVTKYIYQLIFEYFPTFKHFLPVLQTNLRIVRGAIFACQLFRVFKIDNANNSNTAIWRHQNYETLSTLDTNVLSVG